MVSGLVMMWATASCGQVYDRNPGENGLCLTNTAVPIVDGPVIAGPRIPDFGQLCDRVAADRTKRCGARGDINILIYVGAARVVRRHAEPKHSSRRGVEVVTADRKSLARQRILRVDAYPQRGTVGVSVVDDVVERLAVHRSFEVQTRQIATVDDVLLDTDILGLFDDQTLSVAGVLSTEESVARDDDAVASGTYHRGVSVDSADRVPCDNPRTCHPGRAIDADLETVRRHQWRPGSDGVAFYAGIGATEEAYGESTHEECAALYLDAGKGATCSRVVEQDAGCGIGADLFKCAAVEGESVGHSCASSRPRRRYALHS